MQCLEAEPQPYDDCLTVPTTAHLSSVCLCVHLSSGWLPWYTILGSIHRLGQWIFTLSRQSIVLQIRAFRLSDCCTWSNPHDPYGLDIHSGTFSSPKPTGSLHSSTSHSPASFSCHLYILGLFPLSLIFIPHLTRACRCSGVSPSLLHYQ